MFISSLSVCVTRILGLRLWNFRWCCRYASLKQHDHARPTGVKPVAFGFKGTKSRLNLWSYGQCVLGATLFVAQALKFSTSLDVTEVSTVYSHKSCTRPIRCTTLALGLMGGKMGVKCMSLSSLPVCVPRSLGLRLWNRRRNCWRNPRLEQCTSIKIKHDLLGIPRCFGF